MDVDNVVADEATIIENLHRENISPLEESESYQRLVSAGRTIDELAVQLGKSKAYLYQRLTLGRLIPKAQELVAQDILPLHYALKLATVPAERQAEGLARCFRPLFRDEPRRDQLEPLSELIAWIVKAIRFDPHSEDTTVLLPELAEQVVSAEQERHASILALSTLHFHTDRTDPKPILSKSWKAVEGKERCQYARPGVIVLGEGQGSFVQVCIEKKKCKKHWVQTVPADRAVRAKDEIEARAARERQEAAWAKQRQEAERWRNDLRLRAITLIAARTRTLSWSRAIITLLLDEFQTDDLFVELVGRVDRLATRRYPQAVAVALAIRHSWNRDDLTRLAKRLGIKLTTKQLADVAPRASATNNGDATAGRVSGDNAEP
jgi:hypothetical protein